MKKRGVVRRDGAVAVSVSSGCVLRRRCRCCVIVSYAESTIRCFRIPLSFNNVVVTSVSRGVLGRIFVSMSSYRKP
jgi:hypothetical protein